MEEIAPILTAAMPLISALAPVSGHYLRSIDEEGKQMSERYKEANRHKESMEKLKFEMLKYEQQQQKEVDEKRQKKKDEYQSVVDKIQQDMLQRMEANERSASHSFHREVGIKENIPVIERDLDVPDSNLNLGTIQTLDQLASHSVPQIECPPHQNLGVQPNIAPKPNQISTPPIDAKFGSFSKVGIDYFTPAIIASSIAISFLSIAGLGISYFNSRRKRDYRNRRHRHRRIHPRDFTESNERFVEKRRGNEA
jgi:hypothetical protein